MLNCFMFFLTMSCYNILAFLNIGHILNNVIFNMALLPFLLLWDLLTMMLGLIVTLWTVRGARGDDQPGGEEKGKDLHAADL